MKCSYCSAEIKEDEPYLLPLEDVSERIKACFKCALRIYPDWVKMNEILERAEEGPRGDESKTKRVERGSEVRTSAHWFAKFLSGGRG